VACEIWRFRTVGGVGKESKDEEGGKNGKEDSDVNKDFSAQL
jgi:hypothetical protein